MHEGHLEVTLVQFQEIIIFPIDFNDFISNSGHLAIDLGSSGGHAIFGRLEPQGHGQGPQEPKGHRPGPPKRVSDLPGFFLNMGSH